MNTAHALFAADAFYVAFASKDIDAMDALWAKQQPVLCIHPGWPRLTEREAIIESWRNILGNPNQLGPLAYAKQAHVWGSVMGVTCYEHLGGGEHKEGGVILATKAFVMEDGECRLVMHHGSPCNNPPAITPEDLAEAEALQ